MKWSEPEKKKYTYYDNEEQYREKVHYAEMSNGFLIYADINNNIYVINKKGVCDYVKERFN